ncbi:unnamed protein product [Rhizoctonia solani]|uniref:Uncharacterized protein n=1 Tax=Rhizoctonia solani TaxID=456999 RepID=A0A8H2X4W5_9AGAM|nr:unnamed protein product [Rhizoctonia solani]
MTSENVVPSSRLLADIFRGLGTILKLETQGIETDFDRSGNQTETHKTLGIPAPQGSTPAFRLEKLILDETTWSTVGRIVNNILGQTMDPNSFRQPGDEGRMMLLMTWADVMLSLREDVADAIVRATGSRSTLKALSSRIDELLSTNQAWNYQRTFDRLARTSSLRPHHENSFGEIGSESDPALDLPVGPAPGEWPISRTLNEAQRISLLVRDRLVEGDSVAALLHFHSLASLCGAFRRLCDATSPADAPSLLVHSSGDDYQRPQEVVLAEARQELEVRVESVYVRLAGHALRTGDSNYVNDVLELAYTLPPRDNKRTFSRVWKRAMSAFVRWRTEWSGSGGIGRAFRTLAHLLGIKFASSKGRQNKNAISEAIPRAITDPSRELFDLGWLREKKSWPDLGRNVFARHYVVSALIEEAEKTTMYNVYPRRQKSEKRYDGRQGIAHVLYHVLWISVRGVKNQECTREKKPLTPQGGATPIAMLVGVLGALKVPMAVGEAEKLGYSGPRHESNTIQKTVTDITRK